MKDKRLGEVPIVVFDTETTGLSPDSYIVEIGAVKLLGTRIVNSFSTLIRPPVPIPKDVIRIHGINNEMVKNAPTFPLILDKFLEFIRGAILVAHNAPFDLKILTYNIKRANRELPGNPVLDTCRMSKSLFPELPSHSLKYLSSYWRSPFEGLHRALSDAKHTAYIFLSILKKCGITEEEKVEKLLEMLGPPLFFRDFEKLYSEDLRSPSLRDLIVSSINRANIIEITYETKDGSFLKRKVLPLNLFIKQDKVLLRAVCPIEGKELVFNEERIKQVRICRDEVERGAGRSLDFR